MLKTVSFIIAVLFAGSVLPQDNRGQSQENSLVKKQILLLDREIQQAVVIGDTLLIDSTVAADFVFTHGLLTGDVDTKSTWRDFARVNPKTFLSREVDSAVVEIHDDMAMVLGRLNVKANFEDDNKMQTFCYSLHYVHLYQKRNNRWLFISHRTAKMVVPEYRCK
ncbi:MAG TPA: nuclear transport factor 2 family protein [Pedobacter sp.]